METVTRICTSKIYHLNFFISFKYILIVVVIVQVGVIIAMEVRSRVQKFPA